MQTCPPTFLGPNHHVPSLFTCMWPCVKNALAQWWRYRARKSTGQRLGPVQMVAGPLTLPPQHHAFQHWTLNTSDSACFGLIWVVTSTHTILAKIQSLIPILQLDHINFLLLHNKLPQILHLPQTYLTVLVGQRPGSRLEESFFF